MFNDPNKSFENDMKRMLRAIENKQELCGLSQYDLHVLEECANRGYISNVYFQRMASGRITCDIAPNGILIEKQGYEFLYPKFSWLNFFTVLGSVAAVLGLLISNKASILSTLEKIKSMFP